MSDRVLRRRTLDRARRLCLASAVGLLVALALSGQLAASGRLDGLVGPVGLAGIVSLVVGYRLHAWMGERPRARAAEADRCSGYLQALRSALAVTGLTALCGVAVFTFSASPAALTGVAAHVLLAGALWPSEPRLEHWIEQHAERP